LLAFVWFLMPGLGVLTWRQFEQEVGWTNFFVIAASLSLAQALSRSGASDWLAAGVVGAAHAVAESPWMVVGVRLAASSVVRLVIPNITGFHHHSGRDGGGHCVGAEPGDLRADRHDRGHLTAGEIFRFGLLMTALAALVVLAVALPYWALVGEPLAR
jgi:di/tricarboxylate transporter